MDMFTGRILDHLGYKNRLHIEQWEERLWQLHLQGPPADLRGDADRQRFQQLLNRLESQRELALSLHATADIGRRRTAAKPAGVAAANSERFVPQGRPILTLHRSAADSDSRAA